MDESTISKVLPRQSGVSGNYRRGSSCGVAGADSAYDTGVAETTVNRGRSANAQTTAESTMLEDSFVRDTRYALLLSVMGFAFFWTTMFVTVAGSLFAPFDFGGFVDRFLLLLGFVAVCLVSHLGFFDRIAAPEAHRSLRWAVAVVAILFVAVSVVGAFSEVIPAAVRGLLWLLFGAVLAMLAVLWGLAWSLLDAERPDNRTSALALAGSCVLAAVLATFMLFAPAAVSMVVVGAMVEASLVLHVLVVRQFPSPERIDRQTSQQRLKLFSRNMLSPGVVGCVLGCVLVLAMQWLGAEVWFPLCLVGIMTGGLASVAVLALLKRVPRFSSIERILFTIMGAGLLALPFAGAARIAAFAVLIADVACYFVFHWSVLVALSYRHHVQQVFHYSQGLIAPMVGVALGWAATTLATRAVGGDVAAVVLFMVPAVVFLLILDLAIVPYASNKTVEAVFADEDTSEQKEPVVLAHTWRARCEDVCKAFSLTPREQEVFLLLAKGRNAEHIGKQLFISTHTVKTHTSRMYRKLSINSQQELIDLVEAKDTRT